MINQPILLDRASVTEAIADYILEVNFHGYRPDRRKVLAVRQSDRSASLRNAGTPLRQEVYYYIEGELFPAPDTTRLKDGETPCALAGRLVAPRTLHATAAGCSPTFVSVPPPWRPGHEPFRRSAHWLSRAALRPPGYRYRDALRVSL